MAAAQRSVLQISKAVVTHKMWDLFSGSLSIVPESVTSLRHIAQALDSTAVRKIPAEPTGAAKIFQCHCRTNILHSEFTLKSRIQVVE